MCVRSTSTFIRDYGVAGSYLPGEGRTMNREEWMARCAMAYDLGLVTEERLNLMARWLDLVMEEGHSRMSDRHDLGSEEARRARWESIHAFWYGSGGELERLERNSARMYRPSTGKSQGNPLATKANDVEGSEIIQLAALFAHP